MPRSHDERQAEIIHSLKRKEAKIGGQLFGAVPKGHRREFFCLDERTWVWHEEWTEKGKAQSVTTHYNVRPDGVLKQQGDHYTRLTKQEARNLYRAALAYHQRVEAEYQRALAR
jgi:hypothetical protein